jgi:hypothetical protein
VLITAASSVLGISLAFIATNFLLLMRFVLIKKRSSTVPFIGGIPGALGMLILPFDNAHLYLRSYWWAPLLLDAGTSWVSVTMFWHFIVNAKRDNR